MAGSDNSVEIRITGSVDASVAASANTAKASIADLGAQTTISAKAMAAALQAAGGDLSKITPQMLGLGAAATATSAAVEGLAGSQLASAAATDVETAATVTNTAAHINSRVAYEGLVLIHEAMTGRFTRMAGSAMILGQRMAGAEGTAALLGAVMSPLGLTLLAVGAAAVVVGVATAQYEEQQRNLTASTIGLGAASDQTAEMLTESANAAAAASGESGAAALHSAEAFAAAGVRSQAAITALTGDVKVYGALIGEKTPEALKTLAEAFADPEKGAQRLNEQLGILDSTQLIEIKNLEDMGHKEEATAIMLAALTKRTDEARAAGVGVASQWDAEVAVLQNLWTWLGRVNDQMELFSRFGFMSGQVQQQAAGRGAAAQGAAAADWQRNTTSAAGLRSFEDTPEGRDQQARQNITNNIARASAAMTADKGDPDALHRDAVALRDWTEAAQTWIPTAERAHAIQAADAAIAAARHSHSTSDLVAAQEAKYRAEHAGEAMDPSAVAQGARDEGATAQARGAGHGAHGPDIVSEWTEQLHAQDIASNDYFSDQTAHDLAFWEKMVSQTDGKGKEWLAVQSHIYELSKTLAHQTFDAKIGSLNDQIEADKNNWAAEQKVWTDKLDYIRATFGEQSTEYTAAHREFEAEEARHQGTLAQIDRDGRAEALSELKSGLASAQSIREASARTQESEIRADARYASPAGQIAADRQVAALHQQLLAQQMADAQTAYQAEDAIRSQAIADAMKNDKMETQAYTQAIDAKKAADLDFANKHRQLAQQMVNQERADAQKIQQTWHSMIDPMVSTTGNQIKGLIEGTESWGQALKNIGEQALDVVIATLERIAEQAIVTWAMTEFSQMAAAKVGVSAAAGLAAANATASMAAAPFPLDLTAPAFGASIGASAAAMGSFSQGVNVVPHDMIAQVHAGERIMPAADNSALMGALAGGGRRGGDTHNHINYAPQVTQAGRSFPQQLQDHSSDVLALIRTAFRNGSLKTA